MHAKPFEQLLSMKLKDMENDILNSGIRLPRDLCGIIASYSIFQVELPNDRFFVHFHPSCDSQNPLSSTTKWGKHQITFDNAKYDFKTRQLVLWKEPITIQYSELHDREWNHIIRKQRDLHGLVQVYMKDKHSETMLHEANTELQGSQLNIRGIHAWDPIYIKINLGF